MDIVHDTFVTMNDIADPKVNESVWGWYERTKNFLPNMLTCADLRKIWCYVVIDEYDLNDLRDESDWQENQDNNMNIMAWDNHVFFTDEHELAIFRLRFTEYIDQMGIVTRKEFRYVRPTA